MLQNKYDLIYNEMFKRNYNWLKDNPVAWDNLLVNIEKDDRKCIALVAKDNLNLINMGKIDEICDPLKEYWMRPVLHSTLMVLRGWDSTNFDNENWNPLKQVINENLKQYEIIFDRLIPVKTGLVLCGKVYVNNEIFDINKVRDKIREKGYETDVIYKTDIIHITLLRWIKPLPDNLKDEWLNNIKKLNQITNFGSMKVDNLNIFLASWSMNFETIKLYDKILLRS